MPLIWGLRLSCFWRKDLEEFCGGILWRNVFRGRVFGFSWRKLKEGRIGLRLFLSISLEKGYRRLSLEEFYDRIVSLNMKTQSKSIYIIKKDESKWSTRNIWISIRKILGFSWKIFDYFLRWTFYATFKPVIFWCKTD